MNTNRLQLIPFNKIHILVCLCCVFFFLSHQSASARENSLSYCGVYSIYGASSALGKENNFEELLNSDYVSDKAGSTVADLIKAADKMDVRCAAFAGLGISSLKTAKDPLVLHVASSGQLASYQHWLLFLGIESGQAVVVNSESGVTRMDLAMLMSRWDGIALAVYVGDKPRSRYGKIEMVSAACWILFAAIIVLISYFVANLLTTIFRKLQLELLWFTCSVSLVFFCQYGVNSNGLWQNSVANRYVQSAIGNGDFPRISYQDIAQLLKNDSDVMIIDARDEESCKYGMIPTAVNIPVYFEEIAVSRLLKDISRDKRVVVYCQSSRCVYDETLGVRLTGLGFKNIQLYREGWSGWKEQTSLSNEGKL